ncbi:GNAT family N-acetyltransferase [Deinococcus koreensis]|uniref:GNAT family N-acetyltransferase n=1 Tax=Deinococcus koreensis TaxID=2054903 RepID=UPI001FAFA0A8|nr:GNAT family N-acetyltransferase [Deinococcus koreensis]
MTPRPFADRDTPGWVALSNLVLDRQATVEAFRAEDARRDPAHPMRRWVTLDGAQIVGMAALYFWPFDPPGFLHVSVLVHPQRRGRGLGRALWNHALQEARGHRPAGLVTDVSDLDPASLAWAGRRGFHTHAHRFASELDLTAFDETAFETDLRRAAAQGVTFSDLGSADATTLERFLNFVADRLTETPDLAGHPRWPLGQVRQALHLDSDPRPDWFILAVSPQGEWLGTTAMIRIRHANMAYNELTATHPQARGRGLALPLKLQAIPA